MSTKRRVCVIGAGTAGLSALKNSLQNDLDAICYEQCNEVGGTWLYSEDTTSAPYDDEVHSSMYESLNTNLPKEVMGYPDFHYPNSINESFIDAAQVFKFLKSYAEHFKLMPHIKFQHSVIRVRPRKDDWEVHVRDISTDKYSVAYFDFVFVCNGHYTTPQYPEIDGMNVFKGKQLHSHLYRKPSTVKDSTVIIVGAGPSGMDITNHIYKSAKRVYLSHHLEPAPGTAFMTNVVQKPDVVRFTETGAVFKDGSSEDFDIIIYCTGYKYTFPFLSIDCGLRVDDNFVNPLYKHCISIDHPTMALIGLPFKVCPTHLFDLQARFALKFYTGQKQLPTRREMLADLAKEIELRKANNLCNRQAHEMGKKQSGYYNDLAETADIARIKPLIVRMMEDCSRKYIYALDTYRNTCYRVIDDENFEKFPLK